MIYANELVFELFYATFILAQWFTCLLYVILSLIFIHFNFDLNLAYTYISKNQKIQNRMNLNGHIHKKE